MVNVETVERLDAEDAAKAKDHDVGEDQDDVGQSDEIAVQHVTLSIAEMEPQVVSGSEFGRNQAALWRGTGTR